MVNDAELPDITVPRLRGENRRRLEGHGCRDISEERQVIARKVELVRAILLMMERRRFQEEDEECPDIVPPRADQPCSSRNS